MKPAIRKITVTELTCQRCEYQWVPRKKVDDVRICPECKSAYWDMPKTSK